MDNTEITEKENNNNAAPVQEDNAVQAVPEESATQQAQEGNAAPALETPEEKSRRLESEARARKALKIAKVRSDVDFLCEHFPVSFVKEGREDLAPRPLKIGIFNDLVERIAAIDPEFSKSRIRSALRVYTTRWSYLECVKAGADRIDLDGNTVDTVSEEHAAFAAEKYRESREKYEAVLAEKKKNRRPAFKKKNNAETGADGQERDGQRDNDRSSGKNGDRKFLRRNHRSSGNGDRSGRRPFRQADGFSGQQQNNDKPAGARPREEFAPLPQDSIVPGLEVRVLWGSGSVPATVREVVRDKVTVELSMGMVVKVSCDQIGQK
ncbi:RNA chaperone ProQ [Succinimonas amylolytica]|uniref:RNA chaperone ProQ n=1 Tax=Succinimonas amylolytica TaxID=83769 RepID=UPI00037843B9|nr:RNA chaperone ProQ [Succinimonas amylolytica]